MRRKFRKSEWLRSADKRPIEIDDYNNGMRLFPENLFVGAYVRLKDTKEIVEVRAVTPKKIGYHTAHNNSRLHYVHYSSIEGLPLSTEIFQKLGFEVDERENVISIFDSYCPWEFDIWNYEETTLYKFNYYGQPEEPCGEQKKLMESPWIECVHELQLLNKITPIQFKIKLFDNEKSNNG